MSLGEQMKARKRRKNPGTVPAFFHRGLNQIAQPLALVGSPAGVSPREPLGRKPRAIAISPAPNGWCYTAGIHHLLEPKRSVVGG